MKNVAVITGASGGLGEEFAKLFARDGYNLILVARNTEKLEKLKREIESNYGVIAEISACDLSKARSAEEVFDFCEKKGAEISALVNNAGFGDFGEFYRADMDKLTNMVQVNDMTLMRLTRLILPQMAERKCGKILNVASVASFAPGALMCVYYASKAFVLSFSEALAVEMKPYGVSVTALCPGPTKTGFESTASLQKSGLFKNLKNADAAKTAAFGYKKMQKGKAVAIHGARNRFLVRLMKFAPRSLVRKCVYKIQKEKI